MYVQLNFARTRPWVRNRAAVGTDLALGGSGQPGLYPALHRLEQKGWLRAEWKQSETGREAKFYSLTHAGRRQLAVEKDSWARLSGAVNLIFEEGSR
jgi:DNA-binding PadR family transcriptional regulator